MRRAVLLTAVTAMTLLLIASSAHAQVATVLDGIANQFRTRSATWGPALQQLAYGSFWLLCFIQFAWNVMALAMRGSDLAELVAEGLNNIMRIGFFTFLLTNSLTFGGLIIASFRQAGLSAGGTALSPSDVFATGVNLGVQVWHQMSFWAPETSSALFIAGLIVLGAFALMAAEMLVTLISSYICVAAGVFGMLFGGSSWTSEIAIANLRYCLGVGAKLMIIELLVSIGTGVIGNTAQSFTNSRATNDDLCILIGTPIALLVIVRTVPNEFMRIFAHHASLASGNALVGTAAAAAGAGANVAIGAAGGFAAAGQAARLGHAQIKGSQPSGGENPLAGLMKAGGYGGMNLASAAVSDLGRRVAGMGSDKGYMAWRMRADLAKRTATQVAKNESNAP